MAPRQFRDRRDAGQFLAAQLTVYAGRPDLLVLALPRGGVPVAAEVALALRAPLDILVVRKLGVPGHEELAMGAIASGARRVLNCEIVESLRIPDSVIEAVAAQELAELERRERLYRGHRPPPEIRGRTIVLVDDGLATGATTEAAVLSARKQQAGSVVVAVPVASTNAVERLGRVADNVIALVVDPNFEAVGSYYEVFSQTTDEEVVDLLKAA